MREIKIKECENWLYGLFEGKIRWEYQCKPERRGAEVAMIKIITGVSWYKANDISLNNNIGTLKELKEIVEKYKKLITSELLRE